MNQFVTSADRLAMEARRDIFFSNSANLENRSSSLVAHQYLQGDVGSVLEAGLRGASLPLGKGHQQIEM
jgi:hypothetical protein